MNERKAAMIANKIYAAANAKQISAKDAMKYLDQIMPYMSSAQFAKYNDFSYAVRHNPSFYA
jgi:hypothetical protein